ncbi:hypothetical protein BZA05DRAFT_387830 [Tricharina praecox]|uniref:uncharacterized protein n=1 Tax=Tricharina praecox TaxID=43433 RepID=UPI00221F6CEB|nr:uncharacterized protein BZA05DRAFT_387830 [Tricharina praecox]KAI5856236.1 hypothetical protein BZA05DRAFT_387830 [Tricharina praecox]
MVLQGSRILCFRLITVVGDGCGACGFFTEPGMPQRSMRPKVCGQSCYQCRPLYRYGPASPPTTKLTFDNWVKTEAAYNRALCFYTYLYSICLCFRDGQN